MYVIADIEWNTNEFGLKYPTQLAAVKVDENWNVFCKFASFIRPRDESFHNWWHVSYRGGSAANFLNARVAYSVLAEFICWLDEDDILLWWYEESAKLFRTFVYEILKAPLANKAIILGDYVHEYLSGQAFSHGNAYKLAEAKGIDINKKLKHNSENDVRVMHELVQKIGFPQVDLLKSFEKKNKQSLERKRANAHLRYQYDPATNMMHLLECDKYDHDSMQIKGHAELKVVFRRDIGVCECCRADYRAELRAKNRSLMNKTFYTYIYTPNSSVFHRYDCSIMLNAKHIIGENHYEFIKGMCKVPCKVCKPESSDRKKHIAEQTRSKKLEQELCNSGSSDVSRAVKRHKAAAEERARLLKDDLSEQERSDIYTLTQPRFAFWAARGYTTFHQRSCPKLHGMSELQGFSMYNDAKRAGYRPCRHCNPTPKQNITLSIPITSKRRKNESIEELEPMCKSMGYPYSYDSQYFCLETPVGKWKINTVDFPIKLKHINLVVNPSADDYHDQPRLFLSFVDVFDYIKRHDEKLMCEQMEGEESKQNIILMRQKIRFSGAF